MGEELTLAVLNERLISISANMKDGFSRIEKAVNSLELRIRTLETSAFADIGIQKSQLSMLTARADENKLNIKLIGDELDKYPQSEDVKEVVEKHPQVMAYLGIVKWMLGVFGVMVLGLLWGMLTGSIQIVYSVR